MDFTKQLIHSLITSKANGLGYIAEYDRHQGWVFLKGNTHIWQCAKVMALQN